MPLVSSLASLVAAMREHECSIVVRAVISPTAVLLLLLVESDAGHLLAAAPVWRNLWVSSMITNAAAGWSWGLGNKNLSFVMCVAQPSSLDVLVLVGEVRVQAGLHTIHKLMHRASCCT